ncbi:uncharacterized protein STEHIDRAFT_154884 [Stereum hirsutum FP-91666 SS1]|uniref:uncharacterized protein n=1 Tax=Stereum hirsutum (strain FP-91666) TaxID=721885 RepID=UPI0004409EF8|nr:uncharacterized protein STEHIDRAFT_154884 [Stereum hirsutum FP-91666 SS1]EIM89204.1 hypothetical protein STEHIDRAFT_154884 [Stereum hirsutum FP-91666 SS1]
MSGPALALSEVVLQDKLWVIENYTEVSSTALFGLRVYAICGRMRIILLLAVALTGARIGINIWRALISTGASTEGTQFVTFSACRSTSTPGHDLELFQWTYQHVMEMRRLGQKGITELILRDGIMYFLAVSVIQGANTALSLQAIVLGSTETSLTIANIVTPFNALLPNLFVNRLVLNLRLYSQQQESSESSSLPGIAFVQNRFLGNIGAPLDHDQWDSILDDVFEDAAGDGGADASGHGVYGEGWATRPNANTTLVPVIYDEENSGAIEMVGIERRLSTVAIPSSTIAIPSSIVATP